MAKKIYLPIDEKEREYVLYLYKHRNNFHELPNKDINNLLKIINIGKLDKRDYPKEIYNPKCTKDNKYCRTNDLKSFSFQNKNHFSLL